MADRELVPLHGWGRHPIVEGRERISESLETSTVGVRLARGLGRSYGDASLPLSGDTVAGTRLADRILGFDAETGRLHAEAGLSLSELTWVFLPRGWCSPVMPGTGRITLGGMVAADVHAKNHHVEGTFGQHVERLRIRLADDSVVWTSREEAPDLFRATLGGMGLTGHVLEVVFQLQRVPTPWIWAETERIPDLDSFLRSLKQAAESWPLTMGWIDCLKRGSAMGRGILYRGRWATAEEAPPEPPRPKRRLRVPIDFPGFLLNRWTMSLLNFGYYHAHVPRVRRGIHHPENFFHPLDKITDWNRGYGSRGFTQYQCVLPDSNGEAASTRRFLDLLTGLGVASFLCVIKDCGDEGDGLLSFPRPGTSVAVDIAIRPDTEAIVARLNQRVIEEGGRIYLAKDTFTTAQDFRAMEPRLAGFLEVRRRYDPEGRLRSLLSRRLLDPRQAE